MERLEILLREAFPQAIEFSVFDRTGAGDHFQVVVASPRFDGSRVSSSSGSFTTRWRSPSPTGTTHELRVKTKGSR
jgi:hypothetical protein